MLVCLNVIVYIPAHLSDQIILGIRIQCTAALFLHCHAIINYIQFKQFICRQSHRNIRTSS